MADSRKGSRGGPGGQRGGRGGGSRGAFQPGHGRGSTSVAGEDQRFQSPKDRGGGSKGGQSSRRGSCTGYGYSETSSPRSESSGSGPGSSRSYQSGGSGGYRGRGSQTSIQYSAEPLSLDLPHMNAPLGYLVTQLPATAPEFGKLIPTKTPGTLSQRKVNIQTNFFLATIKVPKELYRYEVAIEKILPPRRDKSEGGDNAAPAPPRLLKKDLRVKIFGWLIPQIRANWERNNGNARLGILHDFSQILVTTSRLQETSYAVHHSQLVDEDDSDISYQITISPAVLNLNLQRIQRTLNDLENANLSEELATIEQIYNILLKNIGGDTYLPLGRNSLMKITDVTDHNYLGMGLFGWQGISAVYTMSTSWKPYINIDIQNSAFIVGQPVKDAVYTILDESRSRARWDDVNTWRDQDFSAVTDILKSCKITRTVKGKRFDAVIRNLSRKPAGEISFWCEEAGQNFTVPQYYLWKYTMKINPLGLALQISATAHVPAEICTIKAKQSYNRMLDEEQVSQNMLKQATQKPQVKVDNIKKAISDLQMTRHPVLKDFGVSFSDQLLELPGTRILSPPELCYGEASAKRGQGSGGIPNRGRIMPQNGAWDQWNHNVQFFKPTKVDSWVILLLDNANANPAFVNEFRKNGENIAGMTIPQPAEIINGQRIQDGNNAEQNITKIIEILNEVKKKHSWSTDKKTFIMVVLPRKGSSLYNQVKQASELLPNAGVLTQCVIKKNFDTANHSVVKNILLKVNCKLGGINHVAVIPRHLNGIDILKTPVMIIGIDVNHPPARGGGVPQPSFAAVTASIDRSGMPYMMNIHAQMKAKPQQQQQPNQKAKVAGAAEVVLNLDKIMVTMLKQFFITTKKNSGVGIKPSKIIVFRDGVGTGQFPDVLHVEMRAIRRACEAYKDDDGNPYRPKITIIAVQKRHKVRFFLETQRGLDNAPVGTVVDKEIARSDFYLLSHGGMMGTSRPTHYQVLWDDSDFSSDEIQALSYYLCHMYARCNKAVSYPAPTYYAHWAAKRASALCKIRGNLPEWWEGTEDNLVTLNQLLQRNGKILSDYPMHFV